MRSKILWSLRFAISELRSEWLFGVGVAMAVCSVLTPTALLWGAKSGMIQTMRNRMLKDPAILEITGQQNSPIGIEWFTQMRGEPMVAFITPSVANISLYGNVYPESAPDKLLEVAYLPTDIGDPIGGDLKWNPLQKEESIPCTVTSSVAEKIGLIEGDRVIIESRRFEQGKPVTGSFKSVIKKVLKPHESTIKAIYLPLPVIERIESYKSGYAVPSLGWNKQVIPRLEIYDTLRVKFASAGADSALAAQLDQLTSSMRMTVVRSAQKDGFEIRSMGEGIEYLDVVKILNQFGHAGPLLNPQAQCEATFAGVGGEKVIIRSSPVGWLTPAEFAEMHSQVSSDHSIKRLAQLEVRSVDANFSELAIEVGPEFTGTPTIEVSPSLAGIIGAAKRRLVQYNQKTGDLLPLRRTYPGFRLHAKTLEDVKPLRILCEKQGIEVRTNEERIQGVLSLDVVLGKFLVFIVIAGGLGGAGALFTSLYLSIERSRRQFAVLQILGISRIYVLMAVLAQAVVMVSVGFLVSFALFQVGAAILTALSQLVLEPGAAVCVLNLTQWMRLLSIAVALAVASGLLAVSRLRFRDPAIVARCE
jgi:putative ABC transport system permease protein